MGVLKARVGGVWVPITQGYTSATAGYVASATGSSPTVTAEVDIASLTWTAIAGHTYRTTAYIVFRQGGAAGEVNAQITDAANAQAKGFAQSVIAGGAAAGTFWVVESNLSGSVTRKLRASASTSSSVANFPYQPTLLVEDITTVQPTDGSMAGVWTAPSLLNGWLNYDTSLYPAAQYRRVGDMVQLRGLVKSGTMATNIFTLPAGFTPSRTLHLMTVANDAVSTLIVNSNGGVYVTTGSNTWVSLSGVQFSVTP